MGQGNWSGYLQTEEVSRKKYLYVLRPVLACLWIEEGLGAVPMEFDTLRHAVVKDREVALAIEQLLVEKRAGQELTLAPQDPVLHGFLDRELQRLKELHWPDAEPPELAELDAFLLRWATATH
jgi:predicted nucleotidyltransferase